MPSLTAEQIQCLSPNAASEYEALRFIELTPSFYRCEQNQERLFAYMASKRMKITVDNLRAAYETLLAAKKLIVLPTSEELERMSPQELQKLTKRFPDAIEHIQRVTSADRVDVPVKRLTREYSRVDYEQVDPALVGRKLSKREIASMTADQLRRWTIANPDSEL